MTKKPLIRFVDPPILVLNDSQDSQMAQSLLDSERIEYRPTSEVAAPENEMPLLIDRGGIHRRLEGVRIWIQFIKHKKRVLPGSYIFASRRRA